MIWQRQLKNYYMPNWRAGREKYGKIRSGQLWRKRDSGMVMRVKNKNGGDR